MNLTDSTQPGRSQPTDYQGSGSSRQAIDPTGRTVDLPADLPANLPADSSANLSSDLSTDLPLDLATCHQLIRSLQTQNRQLQQVLDSMPHCIFWKDRHSIYQGCNRRFAEVAGLASSAAVVGKTDYDLLWTTQEVESFLEADRQVMEHNQAQLYRVEPPSEVNEQQGWVATSKIPLRDPAGQVIGLLGIIEDITERAQEEEALRQSESQLRQQAQQLRQALQELKQTQAQLVQAEKMSSLGQLVAGVAHEINNPVGFIHGNLCHAYEQTQDLLHLIALYQQHYPDPAAAIQDHIRAIDLEFLQADLPRVFRSMEVGSTRIRQIVLSLRSFSRLDEADLKPVDLHEGLDSTLMLLQNRLKEHHPKIQVIKGYGTMPRVECYAGQINQVFMNILSNAIDALEEYRKQAPVTDAAYTAEHLEGSIDGMERAEAIQEQTPEQHQWQPTLWIETQTVDNRAQIRIRDNGAGIPESAIDHIFNPFFTTKAPGKGTGLGLSISYQIVTEQHRGCLTCTSTVGQGAEFLIDLPIQHFDRRTAS